MGLKIAQDSEYLGNDQWKWWVWLDGDDPPIDEVEAVEYHLHPTFPQPVRVVKDRPSRFRLDAVGWGVFALKARVQLRDGSKIGLTHMLELTYPPDTDEPPGEEAPTKAPTRSQPKSGAKRSVFLSAGSADSAVASQLRGSLIDQGVEVWSDEDIEPGGLWNIEIEKALDSSDAVVAVVSDIPSKWMEREVDAATQRGTLVIPVVVGADPVLPAGLRETAQLRVSDLESVQDAARSIADAIDT